MTVLTAITRASLRHNSVFADAATTAIATKAMSMMNTIVPTIVDISVTVTIILMMMTMMAVLLLAKMITMM